MMNVEHHPIADVAHDTGPDDPRRHQVELVNLVADDQRMTGVVAALEAHHTSGLIGQPVNDLSFALIAPLSANHHDIFCHFIPHSRLE